MEDKIHHWV